MQADNGVVISGVDVTTDYGVMLLNGDSDSATNGQATSKNKVEITGDVTLTAELDLTLQAESGNIQRTGKLTLSSKANVIINSDLGSVASGNMNLYIEADTDASGDGARIKSNKTPPVRKSYVHHRCRHRYRIWHWWLGCVGLCASHSTHQTLGPKIGQAPTSSFINPTATLSARRAP